MTKAGVSIPYCCYVFNTTSEKIGTSNFTTSNIGGGFTKEKDDKITIQCTNSGTYYLHVLTVDREGNKNETVSGPVTINAFVKHLIKDGKIVDSNYHFVSWSPSISTSGGSVYIDGSTPYRNNYRNVLGSFECFLCN